MQDIILGLKTLCEMFVDICEEFISVMCPMPPIKFGGPANDAEAIKSDWEKIIGKWNVNEP